MHPQQIQPHLNYTCRYTSQRNATLGTTLANAAQQSLGTCPPEVPNRRMMSQLTIMSIILMGTKMMSMGMSMMLMVTQVFNYVKIQRKRN